MLIQIFVHFDKENPEGIWTLVDYERTLGCGVWVGCRRPWNRHGLGDGLGDGVGPKCCCDHLRNFLKIVPARQFEKHYSITNQGAAPCLRLSGKPRCTYDSNQPGILAPRHWPSLQGRNMPSRLQSWILVGTCQTPSTMSWPSSVFGQIA